MTLTPLDHAAQAMEAAPEDEGARLSFFDRFAASELFLMLDEDPIGESVEPRLFETSEGRFALVFDREDRLTAFAEGPCPYAAVTGRGIASMLADQDIGLGLNLGIAPSSHLISAEEVAWLTATLKAQPSATSNQPETIAPPGHLPERLLTALDARLAQASGLTSAAYLVAVSYAGGRRGHLLAMIDARADAESALARSVQDALTFSGLDAGEIDVTFLASTDPTVDRFAKVGLRFDVPEPQSPDGPSAPGRDPEKPPRLK